MALQWQVLKILNRMLKIRGTGNYKMNLIMSIIQHGVTLNKVCKHLTKRRMMLHSYHFSTALSLATMYTVCKNVECGLTF